LSLDDKAITYLPELRNIDADKLTIRHLLTQTVHYDFRLSDHKDKTPTDLLNVIFRTEFKSRPGTNFFYSNATSVLLGLVVERVFDNRLDELAKEHFFDPLKMSRTGFRPQRRFSQNEIVPTEIQGWRGGEIRGEVHDESAFALQPEIVAGSAGLFTTVPDLLQFLRMLLIGGSVDGKQYFTRDMIKQMYTNQLTDLGEWTGLGWELNQPRYMGKHSRYIFGKTGFTGCVIMCDVKKGFGLALLTNFTYPLRRSDPTLINELRSDLADIVYDNLEAL
jgi:CubicO group peptidase (beta-lactamase class C family)